MYTYPHTIENGGGERLVFLRKVRGQHGDRLEGENVVSPGAGPPMHVHFLQEEGFTVTDGRLGYQIAGRPEAFAGPGESVVFKAGQPHRFWNAGNSDLLCTAYVEPADNVEYLLTELFASAKRGGGAGPDRFEAAFLMRRYRSEFRMLEIPPAVERFVFPMLVAVGTVLGKYRKYADAPEPVRR
jgi:quercetin dioxygenase-like cupin family protein